MNHPLVQSLLLPLVLSFVLAGALGRWWPSAHRRTMAGAAVPLAFVAGSAGLVGWHWLPDSWPAWLPWVSLLAVLAGMAIDAGARAEDGPSAGGWAAVALAFAGWGLWLAANGPSDPRAAIVMAVLSLPVVLGLRLSRSDRGSGLAGAVAASLGLAALVFQSGSLLLFQLALALAASLGGLALWLWLTPRCAIGASACLLAAWAWLGLAHAGAVLTSVPLASLALLSLAFLAGALGARLPLPGRRPLIEPLASAAFAGLAVAAALAWSGAASTQSDGADDDYQPAWREPEPAR